MSLTYKAFGNFSYGKYAQKNESTELVPIRDLQSLPNGTVILGGELALIKRKIKYPRYANCIWAMYTTAIARHELYYRGLLQTQKAGGLLPFRTVIRTLYYTSPKNNSFRTPIDWVILNWKGASATHILNFLSFYKLIPQNRRKPAIYKAKGIPHKAAKRFFLNNKATYKKPNKLRESLRRNLSPKKKYDLIPNYWETREKRNHWKI